MHLESTIAIEQFVITYLIAARRKKLIKNVIFFYNIIHNYKNIRLFVVFKQKLKNIFPAIHLKGNLSWYQGLRYWGCICMVTYVYDTKDLW